MSIITSTRAIYLCFALVLLCPVGGRAQSVALTFDDGLDPHAHPQAATWNAAILTALSNAGVKSILFAAGKNVDSPDGLALVKDWGRAGNQIGNHTYSHRNLGSDDMTLPSFISDAEKDQALLSSMPGWIPRFRFPFLNEGDTAEKHDGFRQWLQKNGYRSGAVSIDASDWYYNNRYLKWKSDHPNGDPAGFRAAYLNHLWERALYYDGLGTKLFHRSVKHVLLLHTNAINAAFLPDIVAMFKAKGWTLISPDSAYQDPVYAEKPTVLPAGQSILWALAKQAGYKDLRYPAEDDVYEKPILDGLGL